MTEESVFLNENLWPQYFSGASSLGKAQGQALEFLVALSKEDAWESDGSEETVLGKGTGRGGR